MSRFVVFFVNDARGATSIEYGIIALVVSVGFLVAATQISVSVKGMYDLVAAAF